MKSYKSPRDENAQICALRAMHIRKSLLAVVSSLVAYGCHQGRFVDVPMPADGDELPILYRVQGVHSHETRALRVVVRDAATLAQIPIADVPVDFRTQMLLVVTLGRVTSDLYSVDVSHVWRERGKLRVETTVHAPPAGAPVSMASPYCIVVIPRCDLNVAEFDARPPSRDRSWQQSEPPKDWGGRP